VSNQYVPVPSVDMDHTITGGDQYPTSPRAETPRQVLSLASFSGEHKTISQPCQTKVQPVSGLPGENQFQLTIMVLTNHFLSNSTHMACYGKLAVNLDLH